MLRTFEHVRQCSSALDTPNFSSIWQVGAAALETRQGRQKAQAFWQLVEGIIAPCMRALGSSEQQLQE
jgi:hypothetical protein